jgi:glycogen operon protein
VSYHDKHNADNGEDNRDGESHNRSWNLGVEGPTDDVEINTRRARQQRNLLTTLLLSQGVPMLLGGDEIGRTQLCNNNAYCQDNETSWFDWENVDESLCEFATALIALRRDHPAFRRRRFFQGRSLHGEGSVDLAWFSPEGDEMNDDAWNHDDLKTITIFIGGSTIEQSARGEAVTDTNFLWLINASHDAVTVNLPAEQWGKRWRVLLDTATSEVNKLDAEFFDAATKVELPDHATMLLELMDPDNE